MNILIKEADELKKWDNELEALGGSIFLSRSWIENIADHNHHPLFLQFFNEGKLIAMLAGLDTPVRNHQQRQLFFYSGMATVGQDILLVKNCKTALFKYAKSRGYARITLKSYDNHTPVNPVAKPLYKPYRRMEYCFDLTRGWESIVNGFDQDIRRRARKAEKEGLIFKESNSIELVNTLFDLLQTTYTTRKKKGYGNYSFLFLPYFNRDQIIKLLLSGSASFFYTEYNGTVLSMQLFFRARRGVYGLLMGTSIKGYKMSAPSLLFARGVKELATSNYSYYNLGGVQRNQSHVGLKRFKDKLGAEIIHSVEETTNFISPPLIRYNPVLRLKHIISKSSIIPGRIKKPLILGCDYILNQADKY